jgi:hypothetical protein
MSATPTTSVTPSITGTCFPDGSSPANVVCVLKLDPAGQQAFIAAIPNVNVGTNGQIGSVGGAIGDTGSILLGRLGALIGNALGGVKAGSIGANIGSKIGSVGGNALDSIFGT